MSQKLPGTYSDVCCDRSACRRPTGPLFARSKQHAAPDKRVEVQLSLDEHTTRRERQEQARRVTNTDAHAQEGRVSARRLVFRQLVREQELSINNCTSGYLDLPLHEPGSTGLQPTSRFLHNVLEGQSCYLLSWQSCFSAAR